MTVTQADLVGYINPTGQKTSFLVPVYRAGKQFLLQEMQEDNAIKSFAPVTDSISSRMIKAEAIIPLQVGDAAIFAFKFPDLSIVRGTKVHISNTLYWRHHELLKYPFVALAVARFIDNVRIGRKQVFKTSHQLQRKNGAVGHEWLERELHNLQPDIGQPQLTTFTRCTKDHVIFADIEQRLHAGRNVYVRLKLYRSAAGLPPNARNLLASFGLEKARIGKATRFVPVIIGTLRNIKQMSHLARVIELIELPSEFMQSKENAETKEFRSGQAGHSDIVCECPNV